LFPRRRSVVRSPLSPLPLVVALLGCSHVFAGEASQEPTVADAGASRPTVEAVRAHLVAFGGVLTAGADGLESGSLFGGSAAFFFLKRFGIEAGVHRRTLDVVKTSSNALSGGSLGSTIVTGSVVARFPVSSRVAPYVVAGVAHFSNEFEVNPAISGELAALNFRLTEDVKSTVGFNVGGGVDVLVARRFAAFGELRYLGGAPDTRAELRDSISGTTAAVSGSQDLNGLEIRVGVRFLFPRGPRKVTSS
jgi:Outer membrane protein beta-barrel domain